MAVVKFKANVNLSDHAQDWGGAEDQVRLRIPFASGIKKQVDVVPGQVLSTEDSRAQKALKYWVPAPIKVNGDWMKDRTYRFAETEDAVDIDLDAL